MTVPVTFTVITAPVPPVIGISPTSLSFTAPQGGTNPATQTLNISNTGGGTLTLVGQRQCCLVKPLSNSRNWEWDDHNNCSDRKFISW